MRRRILLPKTKIEIRWSSNFAYAIGLLVTDGCVYSDMRHINLTSKDVEQILHFKRALKLTNRIGMKSRGGSGEKMYFQIQTGDVNFVRFLQSIGIGPAKSKTIGSVGVPDEYFIDFLRGCFDGDGTFYSYWDTRWRSSFMFYISFVSASDEFITWLRERIASIIGVKGHVTNNNEKFWQLRFAKKEAEIIIRRMYYSESCFYLTRKRLKINQAFAMIGKQKV